MSSAIYINSLRKESVAHNPYYEFFRDSVGKGDNLYHAGLGDLISTLPDTYSGYGLMQRNRYYHTRRVQLGAGWFSDLFNKAKPLLLKGLKFGAKHVADVGSKVANDALSGVNIKDSLKRHVKDKVEDVLPESVASMINKRIGSGKRKASKKNLVKRRRRKYPVLGLIS